MIALNGCGTADDRPISVPVRQDLLVGDPNPALTRHAHSILIDRLISYGNVLSKEHHGALLAILSDFTRVGYGVLVGRFAYPLPCGMGKSQAVLAWLIALHELNLLDRLHVAVFMGKVEALCALKRELIAAGVPAESIGLQHSYAFEASLPGDNLPPGYASEPATPNAPQRPVLLATHSRMRRLTATDIDASDSHPRDIVIWDEAMLSTEPIFFSLNTLGQVALALLPLLPPEGATAKVLRRLEALVAEARRRRDEGVRPTDFNLIGLPIDEALAELNAVKSWSNAVRMLRREMANFLEQSLASWTYVDTHQGSGLVSYSVVIPPELDRIAVLDASYNARMLERIDPSLSLRLHGMERLKQFQNVVLRHINIAGGRESVERDYADTSPSGRRVARLVAEMAALAPSDEGIVVFTHKRKDEESPDAVSIIKKTLRANGIDPDSQILLEGRLLPRFVFLHWGQETALSSHSYCRHVVLAGLMYRQALDLAAHLCGQTGNLLLQPDNAMLGDASEGEQLHAAYQAVNRGSCRIVRDGEALPMTITLMVKGDGLKNGLQALMPGLKWVQWKSPILFKEDSTAKAVGTIVDYLASLQASTVSTRALKQAMPESVRMLPDRVFAAARETAAQLAGWMSNKRSLVRRQPTLT